MSAAIRSALFSAMCDLISERTGLWMGAGLRRRIQRLLPERLAVGDYRHASEYYHFLRDDPFGRKEISDLAALLTRRKPRLMNTAVSALVGAFAKSRAGENPRRLAALAVGTVAAEDIHTAAIILRGAGADVTSPGVTMTAAGADLDSLVRGSDGVYTARALTHVTRQALEECFDLLPAGRYRLKRSLRERVRWLHADPLHGWQGIRCTRPCDLIICREYLNYLTFPVLRTWTNVQRLLAPGGLLICDRRIEPDGSVELSQCGRYWLYARSREAAAPSVRQAADSGPDAALRQAMKVVARGDDGASERYLSNAIEGEPFNASYRVAMVLLLLQKKAFEQAQSHGLAALALAPHSPYVLFGCGVAHERLNRLRTAERFYRKALLVRPTMAAAHLRLAELYKRRGREAEATDVYAHLKEILNDEPGCARIHNR